jgi:hypothetical protein
VIPYSVRSDSTFIVQKCNILSSLLISLYTNQNSYRVNSFDSILSVLNVLSKEDYGRVLNELGITEQPIAGMLQQVDAVRASRKRLKSAKANPKAKKSGGDETSSVKTKGSVKSKASKGSAKSGKSSTSTKASKGDDKKAPATKSGGSEKKKAPAKKKKK